MAIAFVAKTENLVATAVTSQAFTLSTPATAGNFLVVAIRVSAIGRTVTVTNDVAQTATRALVNSNSGELNIFYFENVGAATTVTVATSGAATSYRVTIHEYSGIATSGALDQIASATNNDASPNSGATAATTQADELVFGAAENGAGRTYTLGAGYSDLAQSPNTAFNALIGAEGKVVAATGAQTATFTINAATTWTCGVATFKGAVAATGGGPGGPTLMGIG